MPNLSLLSVDILEINNYKARKFYKNPYQYILFLMISYHSANFRGEGS